MTEKAQIIAIAEACRWKKTHIMQMGTKGKYVRTYQKGRGKLHQHLPDYLNDLNAMHEAEQILWGMNWSNRYAFNDNLANTLKGRTVNRNEWDAETLLDATAAQRAEAFLRTIGKWKTKENKL